jgi:peptide/nickel transport system substrate-binding protein
MMHRRTLAKIALSAPLLVGFGGGAFAQDEAVITGGFDVGPGGQPGNFNPMTATAGYTWLNTYLEPLVIYDATLANIVGALATRFTVSADQLTYTFKLADTRWHDGHAFTSADVAFTLAVAKNPASGSNYTARLAGVTAVETPDAHTVVLKLASPNAALLDTLSKVFIVPQHALSAIPVADLARHPWWSTTPIGTGPFKFVRYLSGQYVSLAANADYRLGKPKVDRLVNRYFENTAGAVAALRSGEIQFTYVEPDDLPNFKGNPAFRIIEGNSYVVNYLGFNQEVKLWQDVRVRQAVMHAIDRATIIKQLYGGAAVPANCGYVAASVVPAGIDPYGFDPAKARALLAAAGWDRIAGSKPITLLTYYNNPLAANVMAAIQAMLADVGINVVPRIVDVPTYNSIVYAATPDWNSFPMVYAGFQDGPDPSSLNTALNATQVPPAGANIMRVRTPALTSALNTALAETDGSKRAGRYQDVCRVMNAELPWGTLWVTSRYGVASSRLKDFTWIPAPSGGPFEQHAEKWSLGV